MANANGPMTSGNSSMPSQQPPHTVLQDSGNRASSSSSSSSSPAKQQLRILTLNVWGLKFFSKLRQVRIPAIAARLAASTYDVVALQEIWCESTDWRELQSRCSTTFPYSKFFYTGAFGSGLAILSRFPIVSTHTHAYSLNGHPVMVHHGDWIVAKATGCATIDVPGLGLVDVWTTHTVAAGGEDGPEARRAHRIAQAYELAHHARTSAAKGRHVICLGDLNSTPPSLSIAVLRDVGQLSDAFLQAHPALPAHAVTLPATSSRMRPDPRRSIAELGVTCDSPLNTWTAGKQLDDRALRGAGKRLDYILFRGPSNAPTKDGRLRCTECNVNFTELIEGQQCSYSDHFGLEAVFDIERATAAGADENTLPVRESSRLSQTLTSSLSALSAARSASRQTQRTHFFFFLAAFILAFSLVGFAGSKSMGAKHGFGAFWAFLAVILAWFATTALYSAVVWGEWEKRALRTFLEAMELDLSQIRQRHSTYVSSPPMPKVQLTSSTKAGDEDSLIDTARARMGDASAGERLVNVD